MRHRAFSAAVPLAIAFLFTAASASAQSPQAATTISTPEVSLLPQSFGAWQSHVLSDVPVQPFSLVNVNKAALEECNPQRSKTADYTQVDSTGHGRTMHVEAVEFNDATGAYSAFTLSLLPTLKLSKDLGTNTAIGAGGVLFTSGNTLVLAAPATAADLPQLKQLEAALPKIGGPRSQPPLLPTFFPAKGLEPATLHYALGPQSYNVMGGALPSNQLGWDKSAEAATAQFTDKRGKETLTLLLYPTPQIAGDHTRALAASTPNAKVRREGELVLVATGTFSPDDAQNLIENIHLRSDVSFDKAMPLSFPTELHKTYSLLTSIAVFSAVGGLAAILLGLFLGFGRATLRKMRGLDAATEAEFLSLHLDPQNPRPKFDANLDPPPA